MKKLSLKDLKVSSFTTSLDGSSVHTVKGGGGSAALCCAKTNYQLCTAPTVYNESCDSSPEEICK